MKFQKRGRLGTKLLMKCHKCKNDCQPKDGDWHDGEAGQVFLCRTCEPSRSPFDRPKLRVSLLTATPQVRA
ncbi:MAG TPA: hypothetical protein VIH99_11875 [Bdellovibrionota bacterium]|jgi:hypothetical protein